MIYVTLLAAVAAGVYGVSQRGSAGSAGSAQAATRLVITESASGKTFTLKRTSSAVLRLGRKWVWTQPKVRGRAVVLSATDYESDPGFREWLISRRFAGTARITARGRPNCDGCTRRARSFAVTLKVR